MDENGDIFLQLNDKGTRRITVNEFKGKWMVNVREYYEKDGKMLPGKKVSAPDRYGKEKKSDLCDRVSR